MARRTTTDSLTIKDLQDALADLHDRFPALSDDDLFTLWFLRAYITESESEAAGAVTGTSGDKGVDGILIDNPVRTVFVVQAKYRKQIGGKAEKRADVISFAELALRLCEPDELAFGDYLKTTDPTVAQHLRQARKRVLKDNYRVRLSYVTLGNCSTSVVKDVQQLVKKAGCDAHIDVITGRRIMLLVRDYLDGVAPPIPTLGLEMEAGANVKVNGVSQRYDHRTKIESWVFSMRGDAVASLFESAGVRLFARNIRGFLGHSTAVNEGMIATLDEEPEHFFYFNNGITMICDHAERRSHQGRDILQVSNPQVINGQQTTRTLAAHPRLAAKASVLVKVIQIPRDQGKHDGFDALVSSIVAGTNWQNAIRPSDLMANDRCQIELERNLRKVGFMYLRKRQTKSEMRAFGGGKQYHVVKKEELAQAVAGCEEDPVVARSGRERLFEDELYTRVFSNSDPNFYLPRYCLMREVTYAAKGYPARGYAKWVVLNFVWSHLAPHVRKGRDARAFYMMWQRNRYRAPFDYLFTAIDRVYVQALRYHKKNAGKGATATDASTFFRHKKGRDKEFAAFWKTQTPPNVRRTFDRSLQRVAAAIGDFDG
ncbi:MAG: AIPR family protein [Sedimentisphaerales bacterium]|nr:AIPR family protein [Sedimentisphaerales bacterium]